MESKDQTQGNFLNSSPKAGDKNMKPRLEMTANSDNDNIFH